MTKIMTLTRNLLLLLLLLSLCLININTDKYTYAEITDTPQWIRILDEETKLYTNSNTLKVTCVLEKSYYVRVIGATSQFYQVEVMNNTPSFPKITGYVLADKVEKVNTQPELPYYPTESITVKEHSATMYLSPLTTSEVLFVATNTQSMSYYGKITSQGKVWYYVYYSGSFGYVIADYVTQPDIDLHPTPLPVEEPEEEIPQTPETPTDNPTTEPTSNTSQIILTVFVILLAVGIVLALFLPNKLSKNASDSYYDKYM